MNKDNRTKIMDVLDLIQKLSHVEEDIESLKLLFQATKSMVEVLYLVTKLDKEEREQEIQVRSLQDENGMAGEELE